MFSRTSTSIRVLGLLAASLLVVSCSKSSKSGTSSSMTDASTAASSAAAGASKSLMDQLGGMSGATKLAEDFGKNIAANPTLSSSLNADDVKNAENGLVNDIAKASGMAANGDMTLLSALSGKGLTADGVTEVTNALSSAASAMKLSPATTTALMGIMDPVAKSLLGQ
jgi:truncated hemoglobin YjbI